MANKREGDNGQATIELNDSEKSYLLVGMYQRIDVVQEALEVRLRGQDPQLIRCKLLKHGFLPGTEVEDVVRQLIGVTFECAAFRYLRDTLDRRFYYLVDSKATGKIFRQWRECTDRSLPRVLPDGILLKNMDRKTFICGFAEYAMRPEASRDGNSDRSKSVQARRLRFLVDFLSTNQNRDDFIKVMYGNVPKNWPNRTVKLVKPEEFNIYYVLPKGRYLPDDMKSHNIIQVNMPFFGDEFVKVARWIIADYFGVEIDGLTGDVVRSEEIAHNFLG
jgi:hypothetical protein